MAFLSETRTMTMPILTADYRANFRDVCKNLVRRCSGETEHYHQKPGVRREHSSIQLPEKRNIISKLAFSSWFSFHVHGFLPVSSTVPANYKVLWLSVTHVNVKVILWHQIHIMENETVPVLFF